MLIYLFCEGPFDLWIYALTAVRGLRHSLQTFTFQNQPNMMGEMACNNSLIKKKGT